MTRKMAWFPCFQESVIHATLLNLGMLSSKLPWHMIIERASAVKTLFASDKTKSLFRTKNLLHCIIDT